VAFPRFRGRIVDMTGSLLLVGERTGGTNIYGAYDRAPKTASPIQGLSATSRLSPDGRQVASRPGSRSEFAYDQTVLVLSHGDEDEWTLTHEIVFPKAVHHIHGWSETNSLIAVTEWARAGLHFRIVDTAAGSVIKESKNKAITCTGSLIWSQDGSTVIYTGLTRGNEGWNWDLYSERLESSAGSLASFLKHR
jgi:hypothetical protein